MKMKKTNIAIAILLLLTISIIIGCTQAPTGKVTEEKYITLGYIGPLSGDAMPYGETEINAINMAIEEINNAGGINGKQIKLIAEDGKCSGKEATIAAQKLVNIDTVKIILGGSCSSETMAVAPITEPKEVILFSSLSSNPQISKLGEYIFRNTPTDLDWVPFAAQQIYEHGYRNIATLAENTDFALNSKNILKKEFEALGGKIAADEIYEQSSRDYRTQITKIKNSNSDLIFLNPQTSKTAGFAAKQIRELGIQTKIYSTYLWNDEESRTIAGEAAEGISYFDIAGLETEKGKKYIAKYKDKYGEPSNEYLAGARYDAVYILASSIKKCNMNTSCIKDYLYNIKNIKGTIGEYSFNEKGDMTKIPFVLKEIKNGEPVIIE